MIAYADDSTFNGEWNYGKRHGYGEHKSADGTIHKGQWHEDVKHGEGELHLPNGRIIHTTWENDRMHGKANIIELGGKKTNSLFYKGMEVKASEQNPDCFHLSWLNFILVLCIVGCLIGYHFSYSNQTKNDKNLFFVAAFFYIVMIVETSYSRTYKFLANIESTDHIQEIINTVRVNPPTV